MLAVTFSLFSSRDTLAAGPLVSFCARGGLGSVVVFILPSPLGNDWTRLSAFVFPVMLLTASLAGFRPRRLVVLALAVALAYNLVPYALLVPSRLDNQTQSGASGGRRSASSARTNRRLPRGGRADGGTLGGVLDPEGGLPLARGWYRQLDTADNPGLYENDLDAAAYRHWLRSDAVRYVLLSTTAPLDWDGGPQEAHVLRALHSGLNVVFRDRNWTIYELPRATPLLTGPAHPVVTSFGHTTIRGAVFAAGRYLLRNHYSPYLRLQGSGCVSQGPDKMTYLDLTRPERFSLSVPGTPDGLVRELFGGTEATCTSGES